jgi:hypothetical protein
MNAKVAVVSSDPDLRRACGLHPELLHFPDLPALTEALVAELKPQIFAIKETLRAHPEPLVGGGVKVLLARRFENTVTQAAKRF